MLKKLLLAGAALLALAGCNEDDAKVASRNLSKAADNFEIGRRVVFINGITDKYLFEITGLCSLDSGQSARSVTVTCKTDKGFVKHILGLSDNVTFLVEQLKDAKVSVDMYRVTFKPSTIIPDIDIRGSLTTNPVPAQR
jgi:hypothetical protein